jgi:hypothetical protein
LILVIPHIQKFLFAAMDGGPPHFPRKFQKLMAHNVPAVYEVLPARIRALRSKDQGWQNVGGVSRGNGA